jgi:hypothetical protein
MIYLCLTTEPYTYSRPVLCGEHFLEMDSIELLSVAYDPNNIVYKKDNIVAELIYKLYKEI